MSSVSVTSGVPCRFDAGETVRFTTSNSSYPATLWTLAFILNNGVDPPVSTPATANGTGFNVVLTAAVTAAMKPGSYRWFESFTAITPTTEKAIGCSGIIDVLPNPTTTAVPTFAAAQVALLETAIAALGASGGFTSVSFNGQSFSTDGLGTYRVQLAYWKSRVIAENNQAAALRGERTGGHIPVTFVAGNCEETCP